MGKTESFAISKRQVWEAYKKVKANRGSAGVDGIDFNAFEADLENSLYKLWNRMASGSYMPPPVLRVEIPKSDGGIRQLGIPTIADRIAQMVVKEYLEPELEKYFHPDSYGYRPGKSAHQALERSEKRCREYPFVLDMDIKGFFDNIDHELLIKAVEVHTRTKWVLTYIRRWLVAPVQTKEGLRTREKGTPQGGVISPLLANLFLHYAFDRWMQKHYPDIPFERYADDIVCHCRSETEAVALKAELNERMHECRLTLHPEKTKIVYCKSGKRKGDYEHVSFDFLGFTFQPRVLKNKATGKLFVGFYPAISTKAAKQMRSAFRKSKVHLRTDLSIEEISEYWTPTIRGWINYFARFSKYRLLEVMRYFDRRLERWAKRKFKHLKRRQGKAHRWLAALAKSTPRLFPHWQLKYQAIER
jgi:RNA-directed DNA polymerase